MGLKGNQVKSNVVRSKLGLPTNGKIKYTDVPKLAEYFKCSVKLYVHPIKHEEEVKLEYVHPDSKSKLLHIHLINNHYNVELVPRTYNYFCSKCGAGTSVDPKTGRRRMLKTNHAGQTECEGGCNPLVLKFLARKKFNKKIVMTRGKFNHKPPNLKNIVWFDFETFQHEGLKGSVVYAVGFKRGGDEGVTVLYGDTAFDDFVSYVTTQKDTTFIAHNGARFDHYFLVQAIMKKSGQLGTVTVEEPSKTTKKKDGSVVFKKAKTVEKKLLDYKDIIVNNGRVLSFHFGNGNKLWDLYLFTMAGLDKTAEALKCDFRKDVFDHEKIKSFEDAHKYRSEVTPYLEKDVNVLEEAFVKFSEMMIELEGIDVTKCITLSSMAWKIFTTMLKYEVSFDYSLEEYHAFRDCRYGGRVYPTLKRWKTRCDKKTWKEVMESGEFLVALDVVSLYPSAMRGTPFMNVRYPVGEQKRSENPEETFTSGKLGVFYIKYKANRDIVEPILPRKDKANGGLIWDLNDGEGWYTSVDIENAKEFGYAVKFVRGIYWEESVGDLFNEYVDKYFELKKKAKEEKNPVLKMIAKLQLNGGIYGKTQQKPITEDTLFSSNMGEIDEWKSSHYITEAFLFEEAKTWMLKGDVPNPEIIDRVTKPLHLGGFVLAYSRRVMLHYAKMIDPQLKVPFKVYCDTDSMFVSSKDYQILLEQGAIGEELGMLSNDIDDDGLIIDFIAQSPKTYSCVYINNKDSVKEKTRTKGVPHSSKHVDGGEFVEKITVSHNNFEDYVSSGKKLQVEFPYFDKVGCNKPNVLDPFSIRIRDMTRTCFGSEWRGWDYDDSIGQWFPKGFTGRKLKFS